MTRKADNAVTPSKTIAPPGTGLTIDPVMVAAKIASSRQDCEVIPVGGGTRRMPTATANTIPQRSRRLLEDVLPVGSWSDVSGLAWGGCSTQSSFELGDRKSAGYYSFDKGYSSLLSDMLRASCKSQNPNKTMSGSPLPRSEERTAEEAKALSKSQLRESLVDFCKRLFSLSGAAFR